MLPLQKNTTMTLTPLSAISPIDGRYRKTTEALGAYFSEYALIKYRVFVEIEYFIALYQHPLPQLQGFDKTLGRKVTRHLQKLYRSRRAKH
jgi:adenylosuccinate lyase